MKKKHGKNVEATLKANNVRRDWNGVNPVTKIIPDKRNKKPKHKGKEWDE